MHVGFLGNFGPEHSSENEYLKALRHLGHEVEPIQEGEVRAVNVVERAANVDAFVWVQTFGLAETGGTNEERLAMLHGFRDRGIPTISVHLDRWFGLERAGQVADQAFFRADAVCTADGGHGELWEAHGVRHFWFPPGVSEFECDGGTARPEYESELAFVGSWRSYGHREWKHRGALVGFLNRHYRRRVRFWPAPGKPAVRGEALCDLYASVGMAIGDSCLVGGARSYVSDRVPETIGRGAFLLHPYVDGVTDGTLYTDGEHLATWPLWDWRALKESIDHWLSHPDERQAIAEKGRAHVLAHHTYTVRLRELFDLLRSEALL